MLTGKNRIKHLNKVHQDAMETIEKFQNDSEPEMKAITSYLLEIDEYPCTFLPEGWGSAFSTSKHFAELLRVIFWALYDSGDISFPIVNGKPKIQFVHKDEENYEDSILQEKEREQLRKGLITIEQCADIMDFIARHKEYCRNQVRNCYIQDAARFGWELADLNYIQYANFDFTWKLDSSVISKVQEIRKSLGIDLCFRNS